MPMSITLCEGQHLQVDGALLTVTWARHGRCDIAIRVPDEPEAHVVRRDKLVMKELTNAGWKRIASDGWRHKDHPGQVYSTIDALTEENLI